MGLGAGEALYWWHAEVELCTILCLLGEFGGLEPVLVTAHSHAAVALPLVLTREC